MEHDIERANIGEAAAYGVYFDDTEYDYMQHLRQVGVQEDGVDSVLIDAPSSSTRNAKGKGRGKGKGKGKEWEDELLRDLPSEALASQSEIPRNDALAMQRGVPSELEGLQPDMDPHLRQALEALEDDAFVVDEGIEDDFFADLVGGGERGEEEDVGFEFREEGVISGDELVDGGIDEEDEEERDGYEDEDEDDWEARFAKFKLSREAKAKTRSVGSDLSDDLHSEGGDTVGQLPHITVIGGKRRRKGTSDASGYSMSSSSMFRNEGLTLLDERFDQVLFFLSLSLFLFDTSGNGC